MYWFVVSENYSLMVSILLMVVILVWLNWVRRDFKKFIKDFSF